MILVEESDGRRAFGSCRQWWKDSITKNVQEIVCEVRYWVHLASFTCW